MRELIERIKRAIDPEWPASFDDYSPRNLRDLLWEALAFLEGAEAELTAARVEEREECAAMCESQEGGPAVKAVARGCAAAIRARGSAREI